MRTIVKPTYQCDHCKKLYQIKSYAIAHEPRCKKNPDNFRPCYGCDHLVKKGIDYSVDTYFGESMAYADVLFCEHYQHPVFPPTTNGGLELNGDNEPMPKTCEWKSYTVEIS